VLDLEILAEPDRVPRTKKPRTQLDVLDARNRIVLVESTYLFKGPSANGPASRPEGGGSLPAFLVDEMVQQVPVLGEERRIARRFVV